MWHMPRREITLFVITTSQPRRKKEKKKRKLMKPVIHRSAKYCSVPHKLDLIVKCEYKVLSLLLQTADSLQTRIK